MKKAHVLSLALAIQLLAGCAGPSVVGLAAGAGATVGIAAAREGGVSSAAEDLAIRAKVNDKWFKYSVSTFAKLNLSVDQGRVLITGIVQNPDDRVQAVRLAWQVEGVNQVINEIKIANSQSFGSYAQDLWITTRLRTAMTFDPDVQSINYSIDTVDGTVYLMGVYQDKAELDEVTGLARDIPHVKQVISYAKHAGEPLPKTETPPPAQKQPSLISAAPDRGLSKMEPSGGAVPSTHVLLSQPATQGNPAVSTETQSGGLQPEHVQSRPLNN